MRRNTPVQEERLALLDALQQLPLKVRPEEQEGILAGLSAQELASGALDLRPYMQRTPFVLQARACAPHHAFSSMHVFLGMRQGQQRMLCQASNASTWEQGGPS
jgi:chloride channel 7